MVHVHMYELVRIEYGSSVGPCLPVLVLGFGMHVRFDQEEEDCRVVVVVLAVLRIIANR